MLHGSLLDSRHRSSFIGNGSSTLSLSEHALTNDEATNKSSNDIQSIIPSTTMHLKNSTSCLENGHEYAGGRAPTPSITHSVDFFRWTPGHRHVMLTFCTICLFAFMTGIEYAVILPTAYDYVKTMTNADIYVGLILSSYSISGSITGIIMGKISDITGKVKFLILISTVFEIGGNILYFTGKSIRIVLLGRLVAGVGMGAVPPILAVVAHRTTESDRTKAISIILGCRQLGLLIGPCFTLLVRLMNFHIGSIHVYNLNGPGFLMAGIWLILVIICWLCFYDRTSPPTTTGSSSNGHSTADSVNHKHTRSTHSSRQEKSKVSFKTYREQYIRTEMFVLFLGTFITYFNQTALETIVAAFTEKHFKWTTVHTSILFAFAGLEIIIVYVAMIKIFSKRVEDRKLLVFGFISLTLACIVGTFFTWASYGVGWFRPSGTSVVNKSLLALFIVFVVLDLLGLPFVAATSVSLFTKLTSEELQGFSQGVQRSVMGIGTIVGPLFASLLLNRLHIMMTIMLALIFLTLIAIVIVIKRLDTSSTKATLNDIEDVHSNHNHNSSLRSDGHELQSELMQSSKNSYTALVQHDDEQTDDMVNKKYTCNSITKRYIIVSRTVMCKINQMSIVQILLICYVRQLN